MRGWILIGGNV